MTGRCKSAALAVLCVLGVGIAQSLGTVAGTVTDPSGAVIPHATVELSNPQTGFNRKLQTDSTGNYTFPGVPFGTYNLTIDSPGFKQHKQAIQVSRSVVLRIDVCLNVGEVASVVDVTATPATLSVQTSAAGPPSKVAARGVRVRRYKFNTEQYDHFQENEFTEVRRNPLSTFSADVDTASYSNVRRMLRDGQLPPPGAVRIEELINYFSYSYPEPSGEHPFSVTAEMASCPWKPEHSLIHIGLRTRSIDVSQLPPSNLVFLIDVSGSMNHPVKLPLVKRSLRLLVEQLRERDRVAIVVYAGAAGTVLPPVPGSDKARIIAAVDELTPGGSTHGAQGIRLAYQLARESFLQGGNNRVILATDGDFNVGVSSDDELVRLVERERESNIYLTVLGFGMGNLKDSKMEKLADHGNGNYAYIDSLSEARKVLVKQMSATLLTVAKDVKFQVEFNPARVKAYRLIGYENRILRPEEFNDDKKDAGDIGAGVAVTALYEVIPANSKEELPRIDDLRYQRTAVTAAASSSEVAMLKFRYKHPAESKSVLFTRELVDGRTAFADAPPDLRFAAAVAEYGMLLRRSKFAAASSFDHVLSVAAETRGDDRGGHRAEFIELVRAAMSLHSLGPPSGRGGF